MRSAKPERRERGKAIDAFLARRSAHRTTKKAHRSAARQLRRAEAGAALHHRSAGFTRHSPHAMVLTSTGPGSTSPHNGKRATAHAGSTRKTRLLTVGERRSRLGYAPSLRLVGFDPPRRTSISTRKRDRLRSRWVSNRTGESRNDGAKKCSDVGHWRDHMRRRRKPCQSSLFRSRDASLLVVSRPNGQKWRRTEAACDESGEAV